MGLFAQSETLHNCVDDFNDLVLEIYDLGTYLQKVYGYDEISTTIL